jgi:branched-subunit amino acid ABC-type transport system permease component
MSGLEQAIGFGIITSAILGLSALAMTLQHSITRHANFAHGAFLTMAAYMMVALQPITSNLVVEAVIGIAASALLAVLLNVSVLQPFRKVTSNLTILLIVTFAVETIFENGVGIGFGLNFATVVVPTQVAHHVGPFLWTPLDEIILAVAAAAFISVFCVLKYTPFGRAQRAVADDVTLARVVGIRANRVITQTWLLVGALGGLAGVTLAMTTGTFNNQLGFNYLLVTFAAVIVGGLGRPFGALLGAAIIGIVTELTGYYISSGYAQVGALVLLLLVLVTRPQGLLTSSAGELRG